MQHISCGLYYYHFLLSLHPNLQNQCFASDFLVPLWTVWSLALKVSCMGYWTHLTWELEEIPSSLCRCTKSEFHFRWIPKWLIHILVWESPFCTVAIRVFLKFKPTAPGSTHDTPKDLIVLKLPIFLSVSFNYEILCVNLYPYQKIQSPVRVESWVNELEQCSYQER